jgi:cation transport ATPase
LSETFTHVGNQKLMSNSGVAILKATEDYLQENKQWAQTVVIVAFDGAVAGVISIQIP